MAIQHDSDRFHYTKGCAHRGGAAIPWRGRQATLRGMGQADSLAGSLGATTGLCPRGTRRAPGDQRSRGCCLRECSRESGVESALRDDLGRDQEQ